MPPPHGQPHQDKPEPPWLYTLILADMTIPLWLLPEMKLPYSCNNVSIIEQVKISDMKYYHFITIIWICWADSKYNYIFLSGIAKLMQLYIPV